MSSLPSSAEDVRISAGPGSRKSCCRRWLPCIGCLALVGIIVGLSVGLTGKDPVTLASDTYEDLEETYDEYFGDKRDDPTEEDRGSIMLTSNFEYGGELPAKYTSDGEDVSPPLNWADLPEDTKSLVVLLEDHDYPDPDRPASYPWVHWVAFDVSPDLSGLPESMPRDSNLNDVVDPNTGETVSAGAPIVEKVEDGEEREDKVTPGKMHQGSTSWGNDSGYRGPDPPEGQPAHRYYFRVLALDSTVYDKIPDRENKDFVTYTDILDVVEGDDAMVKVLDFGLLMGTYQKA